MNKTNASRVNVYSLSPSPKCRGFWRVDIYQYMNTHPQILSVKCAKACERRSREAILFYLEMNSKGYIRSLNSQPECLLKHHLLAWYIGREMLKDGWVSHNLLSQNATCDSVLPYMNQSKGNPVFCGRKSNIPRYTSVVLIWD